MALAVFGMDAIFGPASGLTLGGYIVGNYSWQWILYVNLPVGVLALFMLSRFVPEPEDIRLANLAAAEKQRANMDWMGIGLLATGLAALQYVLEEGQRDDWFDSRLITVLSVVAVV